MISNRNTLQFQILNFLETPSAQQSRDNFPSSTFHPFYTPSPKLLNLTFHLLVDSNFSSRRPERRWEEKPERSKREILSLALKKKKEEVRESARL